MSIADREMYELRDAFAARADSNGNYAIAYAVLMLVAEQRMFGVRLCELLDQAVKAYCETP